MSKYHFFEEEEGLLPLKFKHGDKEPIFTEIENYTFIFAFDYLSLQGSPLCFNNPLVTANHFVQIFELKKKLSSLSPRKMQDLYNREYHFHRIDLGKKRELVEPLKTLLHYKKSIKQDEFPTLYQIAVFTDNESDIAPRIVGFFGKYAVFHVLWLDYNHSIYARDSSSKR